MKKNTKKIMLISSLGMNAGFIIISALIIALMGFYASNSFAATSQLLNPGFETPGATSKIAANWLTYGSSYSRVATFHSGSWGASMSKTSASGSPAGAYQRIDLNQTVIKPVFIGAYLKGASLVNSTNSFIGASIYAEIHLKSGKIVYWNSISNQGTFDWRWIGFNTGTLTAIDSPIDYIFVIPIIAGTKGTAYFDDIQVVEYAPVKPALTIMIDDGEDTNYTQAKPIMDKYGFVGSSAVIANYVGTSGYMSWTQILGLAKSGWEIVSHGLNHTDLTTVNATTLQREFANSLQKFKDKGLTVNNFALPYGAYNGNVLGVGEKYYKSIRLFEQGLNPQGAFPYDVKVRGVYSTTTSDQISSWISDAQKNNEWIILCFHSIAATGDDEYHTSPADFDKFMQIVKNSGISVMTYDKAVDVFKTSPNAQNTVFNP